MPNKLLIDTLREKHPDIVYAVSDTFYWSPTERTVYYNPDDTTQAGLWALLHETGHALLNHITYYSDFELVKMELDAWVEANQMGNELNMHIDEDHIEDCLDSYRDWLHKRSLCPTCNLAGIQINAHVYECIFCHNTWRVSAARFCRTYRRTLRSRTQPSTD